MEIWTETHRAFVNTWECDENDHLNVQFYIKRFDEAARIYSALRGTQSAGRNPPRTRHVRYHAELRPGAMTRILSGQIAGGACAGWIVHRLEDVGSNRLAATAIDAPDVAGGIGDVAEAGAGFALPKGLSSGHLTPLPAEQILAAGGLASGYSTVEPGECDPAGCLAQRHYVARFSDAAPHVWSKVGIGEPWLASNGYGRVAVEKKITHHEPARAGDILIIYSRLEVAGSKTVKLRHEVVGHSGQKPVASAEVLALILDLKTRKSVRLPENFAS